MTETIAGVAIPDTVVVKAATELGLPVGHAQVTQPRAFARPRQFLLDQGYSSAEARSNAQPSPLRTHAQTSRIAYNTLSTKA
jgi:hypothetical protein